MSNIQHLEIKIKSQLGSLNNNFETTYKGNGHLRDVIYPVAMYRMSYFTSVNKINDNFFKNKEAYPDKTSKILTNLAT